MGEQMLEEQEFKPVLSALNFLFFFFSVPLNEYKVLACDIQQLFVAVTIHACSSSGPQYFRVIEDLIVLLGYLQNSKNKRTQSKILFLWISGVGIIEEPKMSFEPNLFLVEAILLKVHPSFYDNIYQL